MSIEISPKSFFEQPSVADMRLISCPGAEELTGLIDKHLVRWAKAAGIDKETFIIPCDCPRFQSGDAKGLVKESVRGDDIFIVVDPGNYSVTYKLFNYENHMSPDDHFANLKRLIQAVAGKAHRGVGYYAQLVRRPSASPCGARKSGLRCGPAGAADHGCAQHHHL